ncbi:hypothetical protein [Mesorhizobium sp. B2-8-9]|nr:hypothetical protein [Mesorhizobium sp. B2-8-9]
MTSPKGRFQRHQIIGRDFVVTPDIEVPEEAKALRDQEPIIPEKIVRI